jgi:hypothetical protein
MDMPVDQVRLKILPECPGAFLLLVNRGCLLDRGHLFTRIFR